MRLMRLGTGGWFDWLLRQGYISPSSAERMVFLDIARAIGMLLVCTNHFVNVYTRPIHSAVADPNPPFVMLINAICRVASPLFVLTSGIMLGFFHTTRAEDFPRLRLHFIDRAIFLATIGHVLIALAFTPQVGFAHAIRLGYMTDTVAFCTVFGFLVLPFIPSLATRLWLGVEIYLVGWILGYVWHPDDPVALTIRGVFLGPDDNGNTIYYDPLLLWFGVYLVGTCIGSWLSSSRRDNLYLAGKKLAIRSAIVMSLTMSIALPIVVLGKYGFIEISPYLYALGKKYPPGPGYLTLWGSAALCLIGSLLVLLRDNKRGLFRGLMEAVGRNSFPVFVTQYFVYYAAMFLLVTHITVPTLPIAIVFYFGSLLGVVLAGMAFDRFRVKRFWTSGLPALVYRLQFRMTKRDELVPAVPWRGCKT